MSNHPTADEKRIYSEFSARADAFVERLMTAYTPQHFSQNKVIHDCVWGTVAFYPWEIQIIDSPLLQRLRRINQLGLAVVAYPSATHTRFEHTLGVVAVVSKMISGINQVESAGVDNTKRETIPPSDIRKLRLAALLHDVGHCFFSHLSETIYGKYPDMQALKSGFDIFSGAQPHEMFAYIIVNTPSFRRFLCATDYPFEGEDPECLLSDVGRMIVGAKLPAREENGLMVRRQYLTDMINGQFDADSLDYLRRDSYATGLALTNHIDRFLYKIRIASREVTEPDGQAVIERGLTLPVSGISTVEELVFSKMMLTRYIYHHQKVVAAESMIGDLVDGLRRGGKLRHPCDFLDFCNDDIFSLGSPLNMVDPDFAAAASSLPVAGDTFRTVGDIAAKVRSRVLPKKAMIINYVNILSLDGKPKPQFEIDDVLNRINSIDNLRDRLFTEAVTVADALGVTPPEKYDIHFAFPKLHIAKNFAKASVVTYDGNFVNMSEIADIGDWANAFTSHSYYGYIFSENENLPVVGIAAVKLFSRYGIGFDLKTVFSNLKQHDSFAEAMEKLGML